MPDAGFMAWISGDDLDRDLDDALHVSVLTIGELRRGVLKLPDGRRRDGFRDFVDQTIADYGARILPIDLPVIEAWSILAERYRSTGISVGFADELIAATALVHDFTLVTRNLRHFEHSGCRMLSPWSE